MGFLSETWRQEPISQGLDLTSTVPYLCVLRYVLVWSSKKGSKRVLKILKNVLLMLYLPPLQLERIQCGWFKCYFQHLTYLVLHCLNEMSGTKREGNSVPILKYLNIKVFFFPAIMICYSIVELMRCRFYLGLHGARTKAYSGHIPIYIPGYTECSDTHDEV